MALEKLRNHLEEHCWTSRRTGAIHVIDAIRACGGPWLASSLQPSRAHDFWKRHVRDFPEIQDKIHLDTYGSRNHSTSTYLNLVNLCDVLARLSTHWASIAREAQKEIRAGAVVESKPETKHGAKRKLVVSDVSDESGDDSDQDESDEEEKPAAAQSTPSNSSKTGSKTCAQKGCPNLKWLKGFCEAHLKSNGLMPSHYLCEYKGQEPCTNRKQLSTGLCKRHANYAEKEQAARKGGEAKRGEFACQFKGCKQWAGGNETCPEHSKPAAQKDGKQEKEESEATKPSRKKRKIDMLVDQDDPFKDLRGPLAENVDLDVQIAALEANLKKKLDEVQRQTWAGWKKAADRARLRLATAQNAQHVPQQVIVYVDNTGQAMMETDEIRRQLHADRAEGLVQTAKTLAHYAPLPISASSAEVDAYEAAMSNAAKILREVVARRIPSASSSSSGAVASGNAA